MENAATDSSASIDDRLARRLRDLRAERGWSLDALARASGVSRATLSRLENAEVSPTAQALGKLCAAYAMPVSRLMRQVEEQVVPHVPRAAQEVWRDPDTGFLRRSVSPPAHGLAGEVLECTLEPGVRVAYERPPRPGLEHHLVLREGRLSVELDGQLHALRPGDCLRYQLSGASAFATPADAGARYLLFIV